MTRLRNRTTVLVAFVAAALVGVPALAQPMGMPKARACAGMQCPAAGPGKACPAGVPGKSAGKCQRPVCLKKINAALSQVTQARKAIQAGDKAAALAALAKIEARLQEIRTLAGKCPMMAQASRPAVVNVTCPMMNKKIDPANVPANCYRQYKGKGVGFCCPGCPRAWDKLSDAEKDARLKKAMQK